MAVSGSYDFARTRNDIIKRALRKVGVVAQGDSPTAEQLTEATEALEEVVKSLSNKVFPFWLLKWKTKALNTASSEVTGTDSTIYTCILKHTSSTDNKPVTGKDWTTYWRARGSTGGAWADGTAYVNIGEFLPDAEVLSVSQAFIRRVNGSDHDLEIVSRSDYFGDTVDKYPEGLPSQLIFEVGLTPRIILYPIPNLTTDVLHYLAWVKMQDFDAAGNNPDVKISWVRTLVYLLTADLSDDYHLPLQERLTFKAEAEALLTEAKKHSTEPDSGQTIRPVYSR